MKERESQKIYDQSSKRKRRKKEHISKLREDNAFKSRETETQKIYDQSVNRKISKKNQISKKREHHAFKLKEIESQKKYDQSEKRKTSKKHKISKKREDSSFKIKEKQSQKIYNQIVERKISKKNQISKKRLDRVFKLKERSAQKLYDSNLNRKLKQKKRLKKLRNNKSFKNRERLTQKIYDSTSNRIIKQRNKLRTLRLSKSFLFAQKQKQANRRRNVFYRNLEKAVNSRKMRIRRYDSLYRIYQNRKHRYFMRHLRRTGDYETLKSNLIKTKQKHLRKKILKKRKQDEALNFILLHRIEFKNEFVQLKRHGSRLQKLKACAYLNFLEERAEMPRYVCICCECLFFKHSVRKSTKDEYDFLRNENTKFQSHYICTTCRQQYKSNPGKQPTLKVTNGLKFPEVPEFISNLTRLEERLVSPIVPFMQIRDLMPHSLNPQLGIKGSVVNIPVSVPEMIETLPRSSNELQTIQLKFKRNLKHQSHYMYETINPSIVAKAAVWLSNLELYKCHQIKWNDAYIAENLHNTQIQNVIIESADQIDYSEKETCNFIILYISILKLTIFSCILSRFKTKYKTSIYGF